MTQPADYVLPSHTKIVSCHCRAGDICVNTGHLVERKRCRIRREKALVPWPFQTGVVVGALLMTLLIVLVTLVRGG